MLDPFPVETLRLKYFDTLLTLKEPVQSESVSLYNIDEDALAEGGQWPWPRQQLAELNRQLLDAGAAAIVYSVLFPETDRFGGDAAFAESMAEIPTFLSAVATTDTSRQQGWHIGVAKLGPVNEHALSYPGILPNVPVLQAAAAGTGIVTTAPEVDGLVRRVPMLVRVGQNLYPALGLDVLRGLAGDPSYQAKAGQSGIQSVRVPNYATIETDQAGRVWVDWGTTFSPKPLAGTIVFVGVTAAGVSPLIPSPRNLIHSHQLQATLFQTLLNGTSPVRPDWALGAEILVVLIFGLLTAWSVRYLPVLVVPLGVIGIGALTASASVWGYLRLGVLVDAAWPVFSSLVVGGTGMAQRMISEYRQKLQIKKQFEHYLDPRQVKQLQKQPDLLKLTGELRYCTFLFTDLRNFTSMSESMSPEKIASIMNTTLTIQVEEIQRSGGMIDKFIGDACFGIFSAPLDLPKHEDRAIEAAVRIQERIKELNKTMDQEIAIGVGLQSGTACVGNMGSSTRFDYTAIGNCVNEAARYESATKEVGVDILIGAETAKESTIDLKYVKDIKVKGKEKALSVYTVS